MKRQTAVTIEQGGFKHKYKITLSSELQKTLLLYYGAAWVKPIAYDDKLMLKGYKGRQGGSKKLLEDRETMICFCARSYTDNESLDKLVRETVSINQLDWGEREKMNVFFPYPKEGKNESNSQLL